MHNHSYSQSSKFLPLETCNLTSISKAFIAATSSVPVGWPSGLRRWFKAPVSSEAWVRIPPLPLFFIFFTFVEFELTLKTFLK